MVNKLLVITNSQHWQMYKTDMFLLNSSGSSIDLIWIGSSVMMLWWRWKPLSGWVPKCPQPFFFLSWSYFGQEPGLRLHPPSSKSAQNQEKWSKFVSQWCLVFRGVSAIIAICQHQSSIPYRPLLQISMGHMIPASVDRFTHPKNHNVLWNLLQEKKKKKNKSQTGAVKCRRRNTTWFWDPA